MCKYIFLISLISCLTEEQVRGYAGQEVCSRVSKVEIRYRDYYTFYLGHNTTTNKVEKYGRFYRFLKNAVNDCCVNMELEFIKDNTTVVTGDGTVLHDVEAAALSVLSDNVTTPRPFVFFFPEFAINKEKVVYDYELPFVKLARSAGPAVVMSKTSSKKQVSVFTIFKESAVMIVFLLMFSWVVGILGWIADHWKNPDEFPSPFILGMFEGFWWAIVTMTTVGYGDKAPRSVPARFLAVIWVMISAVFLSLFTANATSILNQSQQDQDYAKTIGKKIGVFQSKDFYEFHLNLGAEIINFENYYKMVGALRNHEIDRFLFPDYKDLLWVFNKYPEAKKLFEIAKVLESPFQVGMVLAIPPELLDVADNAFLKCVRTGVSYQEKLEKRGLDYGSIIYTKQEEDATALNNSNMLCLTYYLLAVVACLACCGMIWDLWRCHSKRKTRHNNENNVDVEPGNKNGAIIVENEKQDAYDEKDKDDVLSQHDSATWF